MKNKLAILSTVLLTTTLSVNAFAANGYDSDTDHDHVGNSSNEHTASHSMQGNMKAMRAKMQAEMQTIVNTENKAKRQALFAAHKQKMQGMMGMMQKMHGGDCTMMKDGKTGIKHQGETD